MNVVIPFRKLLSVACHFAAKLTLIGRDVDETNPCTIIFFCARPVQVLEQTGFSLIKVWQKA